MKPVPILLVVRELDHGGIERDVTKIAIHLDRSRFEPHVATFRAYGMRYEELKDAGIPLLHVPVSSLKKPDVLVCALRMSRYIREHGIRLVHSWDTSALFAVPLARLLRVRAVLSSMLSSRELLNGPLRRQLRWTDKMVHTLVCNCDAIRRHLINDERVPSERIEICYNGVDASQFHPAIAPKPSSVADASFIIGAVCVLRPEKSLDLLQEAFARVRHLRPGMKLLIVGSGPELSRLEANSRRLGIQHQCVFLPATPSVPQYLRALDIFVSCSYSEAFSNSILEAMACGCCVVGSRVGGTPELLGNDDRGYLFRSGDASDLAQKLTPLILDDELRHNCARRAADFARTNLNIEIAVERIAQIYETVLRRNAAA